MTDGLYLNNIWVAEVECALTLQTNDLTKPDTIQASYSSNFTLPDSLLVRDLLGNAEQLDAGGIYPYRALPAKLVAEGEVIFSGQAQLKSFKGGWTVSLFQTKRALWETLAAKSIRELDLSRFDHPWTIAKINSLVGAAKGVVYPAIDYGAYDADAFADDAIFPAVYVHTLIEQMLAESGYRPDSNWFKDDLLKKLAIPFVDDQANNQDDEWVDARTARVTVSEADSREIDSSSVVYDPMPYTVDSDTDALFYDGAKDNFRPTLRAYVADTAMRLRVQAAQTVKIKVGFGAVEIKFQVLNNGKVVGETYYSVGGPHNLTFTATETIKLDEYVTCAKGDQITIRFIYQHRTTLASSNQRIYIDRVNSWASFKPDSSIRPGDTWIVARNLPEMSCADLLVTLALMTSATYSVDELRKTITLTKLDTIVANTGLAVDWSAKVEESDEPEYIPLLEPYGRRNNLRWKEFDFAAELSPTKGNSSASKKRNPLVTLFGDGVVTTSADNLPEVTDLFELIFAGCQNSDKTITNYGNPVLIRTRRLTGTGSERTIERSSTTPRLILVEPTKTVAAQATTLTPDNTVEKTPLVLTSCWWGERPSKATTPDNKFSLAFDRVGRQGEQTLIQRYFTGLKRVLRRPRLFMVSVYLDPEDIATLDLTRPIRIKQIRVGSLVVSNTYFYLNKLENYISTSPCIAQLVAYF